MLFPPSPRSSMFDGIRMVVDVSQVSNINGARIVGEEGTTYSNEGVEMKVEDGKVLIVVENSSNAARKESPLF